MQISFSGKNPSVLLALVQIFVMWVFHFKSLVIGTPRYLILYGVAVSGDPMIGLYVVRDGYSNWNFWSDRPVKAGDFIPDHTASQYCRFISFNECNHVTAVSHSDFSKWWLNIVNARARSQKKKSSALNFILKERSKPEDQWSCKRSPETRDIYQ